MTQVFARVLGTGLWAGCLVGVVLALRLVFRRAPKWIHVLFWALVGLCLLFPFPVRTPLSLRPASGALAVEGIISDSSILEGRGEISGMAAARTTPLPQNGLTSLAQATAPVPGVGYTIPSGAADPHSLSPLTICTAVWAIGVILLVAWALASDIRLHWRVATAVRLEGNLYQSERVSSPFVLGLFRPRIYLPFGLEGGQLPYVVSHERAHITRKDHWWKAMGFLLLAVYWFNPLLWLAYGLLCRDIELACDEKVIRTLGVEGRAGYAQALLSCSIPRRRIAACPLAFGEVEVRKRVKSVLCYRKPAFWVIVAAVAACIAVAVIFLTDPVDRERTIRIDNVVYTQKGGALEALPEGSQSLRALEAADLARSGGEEGWVGRMLYASGSHFNTLLLETSSGYLPFVCGAGERAVAWLDYTGAPDTMPWGDSMETQVAQFPGVTFRWRPETLTAVSGDSEVELLTGMPIWSAYFCDLTGDGLPELCISSSLGSGLVDQRVQVCDYAQGKTYELADRGVHDYMLSLEGGRLVVTRYPFMEHEGGVEGILTLTSGVLAMDPDSGSTQEGPAAQADGVLPVTPDLDRDGQPEEIRVEGSEDTGYQVKVFRQDGTQLWSARAGLDRGSWNTVLLCRQGEEDFLVEYRPVRDGDVGSYYYTQISLEGGWVQQVDARQVDFTLPTELTGDMASFAYLANSLLRDGLVLLSTWEGNLLIGPRAADELPQLYPVRYTSDREVTAAEGTAALAQRYPIDMVYASGAGSWGTFLTLYQDGTFEGEYTHTGIGGREACRFTGRFGPMTAVSGYAYAMELEELHYERPVGDQWWEDGLLCTATEAYGVAGGTRFILYLPNTPASALEENCLSWWPERLLWEDGTLDTLCAYALYNVNEGPAFFTPTYS